jgi:hypothetical protein
VPFEVSACGQPIDTLPRFKNANDTLNVQRTAPFRGAEPSAENIGDDPHGLFVPNADSMYQDWSASAIELHRCDRQWC